MNTDTALANESVMATSPTFLTERALSLGVLVETGDGSGGTDELLTAAERGDATAAGSVEGRPFRTTCLRMLARTRSSIDETNGGDEDGTGSDGMFE